MEYATPVIPEDTQKIVVDEGGCNQGTCNGR